MILHDDMPVASQGVGTRVVLYVRFLSPSSVVCFGVGAAALPTALLACLLLV